MKELFGRAAIAVIGNSGAIPRALLWRTTAMLHRMTLMMLRFRTRCRLALRRLVPIAIPGDLAPNVTGYKGG
jgi:hypothetical protein